MNVTNLRNIDESIISVDDGRVTVDGQTAPRYTMEELLAVSDYSKPQSADEWEWVNALPRGRELL